VGKKCQKNVKKFCEPQRLMPFLDCLDFSCNQLLVYLLTIQLSGFSCLLDICLQTLSYLLFTAHMLKYGGSDLTSFVTVFFPLQINTKSNQPQYSFGVRHSFYMFGARPLPGEETRPLPY
jgi:hypothetical protein